MSLHRRESFIKHINEHHIKSKSKRTNTFVKIENTNFLETSN